MVFEPSFPYTGLPRKSPEGGLVNGRMFNAAMEAIDRPLAESIALSRVVMPDQTIEQVYNEARGITDDYDTISIFLPPGKRYPVNFELKNNRHLALWTVESPLRVEQETAIYGTLNTEESLLGTRTAKLYTMNVGLGFYGANPLTVNLSGGWWASFRHGVANACLINMNHGTHDCEVSIAEFGTQNYLRIFENAPGSGPNVRIWDSELFVDTGVVNFKMNGSYWEHSNCLFFWWMTGAGGGWDMQSTDATLQLNGTHQVLGLGAAGEIVSNPGAGAQLEFIGDNIFSDLFVLPGTTMSAGAVPSFQGAPSFNSSGGLSPGAVIVPGTRWRDYVGLTGPATFKDLYWNGSAWV